MSRHDFTDEQWAVIEPHRPQRTRKRGRPHNSDRQTLNGILYVLKPAVRGRICRRSEAQTPPWRRLNEWSQDGTRERIWHVFLSQRDAPEKLDWEHAFLDASFAPAQKGAMERCTKVGKVIGVTDGHGLPIELHVHSTQPREVKLAERTLATARVPQPRGRPRSLPKELVADKANDSADYRRRLRRRGIKPTIPTFERRPRKHPKRGRPLRTGPAYRQRWKVERCFGWMDNCRRLVVRYERHVHLSKAFCLVAIM
jgi:transposase